MLVNISLFLVHVKYFIDCVCIWQYQDCGLGLDVSVSRRTNVSSGSHVYKIVSVSVSSQSGPFTSGLKTNFWLNCTGRRDDACRRLLSLLRSFKVTNFDTNRKPVVTSKCIELKYIISCTIFQLSHSICQIVAFDKGMPLINTLVLRNLWIYLHQSCIAKN